jgi:hypothetical protein
VEKFTPEDKKMSWLSSLLGMDAQHNAGQAFGEQRRLNEQAQQLRQQEIDYYQRYGMEAQNDRNQARLGNQQYGQMGLADRQGADYNLGDLYSQFARAYGVSGFGTPRGESAPEAYQTPVQNGRVGGQELMGPHPAGQESGESAYRNYGQYLSGASRPPSPYDLSDTQQQSLNQGVDRINAQRQNAIANYRAQAVAGGMSPNPAMEAYINEQFDRQSNEATTQAAEQARQQVAAGAAALIQQFTNQRNTGANMFGQSIDNNLQIGGQALQQGANAPYFQAAGQTANDAAQMGQMGQYNQQLAGQSFGDLLQLASFALSGGFGGGSLFGGGGGGSSPGGGNDFSFAPPNYHYPEYDQNLYP